MANCLNNELLEVHFAANTFVLLLVKLLMQDCCCKDNCISPESCDYQRQRIKNGSLFIDLVYNEDVIADRDGARWSV